jgi:hypothetical protein
MFCLALVPNLLSIMRVDTCGALLARQQKHRPDHIAIGGPRDGWMDGWQGEALVPRESPGNTRPEGLSATASSGRAGER